MVPQRTTDLSFWTNQGRYAVFEFHDTLSPELLEQVDKCMYKLWNLATHLNIIKILKCITSIWFLAHGDSVQQYTKSNAMSSSNAMSLLDIYAILLHKCLIKIIVWCVKNNSMMSKVPKCDLRLVFLSFAVTFYVSTILLRSLTSLDW